jgi:hypothetical protein
MRIFMKVVQTKHSDVPKISRHWLAVFIVALALVFSGSLTSVQAQAVQRPGGGGDGEEVQTRGPVHEAFAGVVSFNPQAGVVAQKTPPEPIEEMPPEEKPEGDNVTWIPGYWSWDDERNDYLWISGTWRALPPGRAWIAGYWGRSGQGYQWTSGYWVDAAQKEATYLPPPPTTLEAGPNIAAPSPDYMWTPGCWIWASGHYAWRPGYWVVGRPDWDWVPAHYTYTPRGYIYVGGYWDYPVERRGVIFAPVYFAPYVYVRPHFVYSPSVVIDLGVFTDHLFCRPLYHHYYFGDYYAPAYVGVGFYASFSFHIGHYGYDPIYSHHRWEHRHDGDWHHRLEASYRYRRDHDDARPPRTWVQQRNVTVNNNVTINNTRVENRVVVARTIDQDRRRADNPVRYQAVAREERQRLVERNREVQTSREQRRTVEVRPAAQETTGRRADEGRPFTAQVPKSSIVSKPVRDLQAPQIPSQEQRVPRGDSRAQPRREAQEKQRDAQEQERKQGRRQAQTQSVPTPAPTPTPTPAPTTPQRTEEAPRVRQVPSAPQQQRQVQAPRQERQGREVQAVPQPTPPQQPQQQRPVPSISQERRATPQPPGRMAQSPNVITEESQRNARPVEPHLNQSRPQPNPKHEKKGAEHLKGDK